MVRKQRNLLDSKMKNALVKCFEQLKDLAPDLCDRRIHEKLENIFSAKDDRTNNLKTDHNL